MTCREKYALDFPDDPEILEGMCPHHYKYLVAPNSCKGPNSEICEECWNREILSLKVNWGEKEIHRNMAIPECYTDGTEKITSGKAEPCKTNPNVLHKSGPVPWGEKVVQVPMYVTPYVINDGNVDQCANCIHRSPCREYFNENTEELITLSEGEKYCNKWNKVITGNVTMCTHHDVDEESESKKAKTDGEALVQGMIAGMNGAGVGEHNIPKPRRLTNEDIAGIAFLADKEPECVIPPLNFNHNPDAVPLGRAKVEVVDGVKSSIKDSGARREFATGAVRDIQEGKGRCDLLPLDVVARFRGQVLTNISEFQETGDIKYLENALQRYIDKHYDKNVSTVFLEVSKHFEEGAKKYGEYNWQKGIPTHCYIDSAVRHYLKYLRGDKDEPHDRAFVWNILCCIWTCIHKPELNDYRKEKENET